VLVIGAGPAGLMAARKVASGGYSVLIVEKEWDLGIKPCAEVISESDIAVAEIPVSSQFITNNIGGAYIYPPDESQSTKIIGKGYVLNKTLFLYALTNKAVSKGVELLMRGEVREILVEDGRAIAAKYEHKGQMLQTSFKILIGADGTGSITSRSCGFERSKYQVIPTVQYVMVNCNITEREMIRLYFGDDVAPKGYAWIFAKNEYAANVGIGTLGSPTRQYLDKFIRNHPAMFDSASIIKEGGGLVPVGGQIQTVKENVMLCGDSAGQVVPVTGAGIGTAMIAGSMAGETAVLALKADDMSLLNDYPKRYANMESSMHGDFNMLGGLISY
jgi:digeranylgeranylglycerophospholipid reductase